MNKVCRKCQELKEYGNFAKDKRLKSGLKSWCKKCMSISACQWAIRNPDKQKLSALKYRQNNVNKLKAYKAKYQKDHPEHGLAWARKNSDKVKSYRLNYIEKNPGNRKKTTSKYRERNKEKLKLYNTEYAKNHPEKTNARAMKRIACKLNATPDWLTKQQYDEIETFYKTSIEISKNTQIPHQVDHIIPLQGKNVCGLHVPWNLQVISKLDNIKKGNRI